jgi:hypothetical protein
MAVEPDGVRLREMKRSENSIPFVFGTGGRIRQYPRKIDISALVYQRGF